MRSEQRTYDEYWRGDGGWRPTDVLDDEHRHWLRPVAVAGARVLDVGCGDGGRYAGFLLDEGVELHGVDVSAVAVAEARRRGVQAVQASLSERLPFEDDSFDAAVCLEVIEHVVDPEEAVREIHRVLAPGGALVVSVPNVGHWRVRAELLLLGRFNPGGSPATARSAPWRDPHLRFFDQRSLGLLLQHVGFVVERRGGLDRQFLNAAPGLRRLARIRAVDRATRALADRAPRLLAGRTVALATKPRSGSSV